MKRNVSQEETIEEIEAFGFSLAPGSLFCSTMWQGPQGDLNNSCAAF